MRAAVAPPRPSARDPPQLYPQRLVIGGQLRLVTLRRAMRTHDPTCPPLRNTETVLKHQDGLAPARRLTSFPA